MKELSIPNPSGYDMARPSRLVILDDASDGDIRIKKQLQTLSLLIDTPHRTLVTNIEELSSRLRVKYLREIEKGDLMPPSLAITIGRSGQEVFRRLNIGIPSIQMSVKRRKLEDGTERIVTATGEDMHSYIQTSLAEVAKNDNEPKSVAIVDDTIFTGLTVANIRTNVQSELPNARLFGIALTHIPFLSKSYLAPGALPIISGLTIRTSGEGQKGLNSLDAKDFIVDDALLLPNGTSIPFMQEENWMRSWFGSNYNQAMNICDNMKTVYERKR